MVFRGFRKVVDFLKNRLQKPCNPKFYFEMKQKAPFRPWRQKIKAPKTSKKLPIWQ